VTESLFALDATYEPAVDAPPPYSVIDAASGWWQARRRYWRSVGVSDAGSRPALFRAPTPNFSSDSGNLSAIDAGSVFSPVLTELLLSWYGEVSVYDPFAGGPVRGRVADFMGRDYLGVDLSDAQVEANRAAYPDLERLWTNGDATTFVPPVGRYWNAITCPPYHDLERYSDDPADLSNMTWKKFVEAHGEAIARTAAAISPGGFAVWVVGDFRGPDGLLRGFPDLVARQMDDAGLLRWNRHVVRQPLVTAQVRWQSAWKNRRATTTHGEVVVGKKP
jgi:hypothetical protein